jgi:hypothetical protein
VVSHGTCQLPHQTGLALGQIGPRKRVVVHPQPSSTTRASSPSPPATPCHAATPRCTRPTHTPRLPHTIEGAMSVKFEKETIKTTAAAVGGATGKGKEDLLHEVGQALTKGGGVNGYLVVSVALCEV